MRVDVRTRGLVGRFMVGWVGRRGEGGYVYRVESRWQCGEKSSL
jgi:hypothetical protein